MRKNQGKFYDIGLSSNYFFLSLIPKVEGTKWKTDKLVYIKLKDLSNAKYQSEGTNHRKGENICKPYMWQGIRTENI